MTTDKQEWLPLPYHSKYEINRKLNLRYADTKKPVEIDPKRYGLSWKLEHDKGESSNYSLEELIPFFGDIFDFDIDTSDWDECDEYNCREILTREQQWFKYTKTAQTPPNYDFLSVDELINGDYYLIGDMYMLVEEQYFYDDWEDYHNRQLLPSLVVFSTGGDGDFADQHGRYYAVESATFGIVKASDVDRDQLADILKCFAKFAKRRDDGTQDLGHIVKLENGNVYADDCGHIWFGNREVVIDGSCMWSTVSDVGVGQVTGVC